MAAEIKELSPKQVWGYFYELTQIPRPTGHMEAVTRYVASVGKELGLDYTETWSCYKGGEKHCGKCGTCVERKEALRDAGIDDPTIYEGWHQYY